ncbi:hypothetical protein A3K73_08425 [Candidatus Pacearchaeota archaeon RBG_13_36_9]|nr:MAG: hypothetical protein A3K73_08425 [Candidatus Pacearchaeota archaeon RBG_13_36_9]
MKRPQIFFEEPYKEVKKAIAENVKDGFRIIDLGCGDGELEEEINSKFKKCVVYCIDKNKKSLETLKSKKFENVSVEIIEQDANEFLNETALKDIDAILINTILHEINDPSSKKLYLKVFFKILKRVLKEGGKVILGDYFYPPEVSDKEVEEFIEHQKKEIGHADKRNKFVEPEILKKTAMKEGFKVVYLNDIRAIKEINRRYYCLVLEKNLEEEYEDTD